MWLLPEQYLKYSIFIGPIFGIIGVILGFLYGYKIAIGIYIFMAIVVTFAFFFSRHDLFFSRALLQMSIRTQFIKYFPNFILLSVHIVVVSCIAVFYSYSHIAILLLDSISSYAVVYMFLSIIWIINTYCNIVYMISSSTSAAYYFTSSTAREIKIPILRSLLRCCILNVGCAAREAVLVPITQYIHTVARLAPGPTLEKIFHKNDAKPLIKALKKLSYIASIFMKPLDLLLGYPTRQGLIYSSMFGVPYDEGCLRFAEISAKYYCNLLNEIQTIGTNLACHSLNIILIAVTTVVPTCNKLGQYSNVSIPFIFAYAIANAFRQMLRGHYETILVAFSECPNRMKTINREVEEILEQQYGTELQTRCFRQSNQFEDETVE
ncbi:XYPPX repeat family protein [Histomonas meleagridis]|uniref:XYPPX repeat family protein n=1 Tax=Histomonas meleagridis TaxID=135588 RepID=UPI0035596E39|nr:XYPPX repeat family protein [Histomonas meleagridis]KAH0796699.1 XYPPX repeat family protein [Histomonas meleagridis]